MLQQLITALRPAAVDGPLHVAATLKPYLSLPDLLTAEQMEPDPDAYRQHILYVEPDGSFSLVALVWLPGQCTCIHDHVSWCVVGTYIGAEEETRYDLGAGYLLEAGMSVNRAGTVTFIEPPGDIHQVRNVSGDKVISLHVYGADVSKLGSSIRRRYELPVLVS
jgi:predicted metal-dependent enzyme (double-stranded beta helix superfamily)